ncbi:hypothetical protein AB0L40_25720, partial [Patulibacter sp. NPDC049589]|uniref:hypothetical protein n=1 Tax=Patulibacter sp. NPDC049589 TaxID=3154731 RepID=UPI003425C1C9
MSGAVLAAGASGALAAAAIVDLSPDGIRIGGRVLARLRDSGEGHPGEALDRVVPWSVALGLVLLVAGAPVPALAIGVGPAAARAVRRA